jgi:hypothetical protein
MLVDRGQLDEAATLDELRRAVAARANTMTPPSRPRRDVRLMPVERLLLARLLRGVDEVAVLGGVRDEDLAGLRSAPILTAARDLARSGATLTAASLTEALTDDDSRRLLNEIAVADSPADEQGLAECLTELRRLGLARRLEEIQRQLKGGVSAEVLEALLQQKLALQKEIAAL